MENVTSYPSTTTSSPVYWPDFGALQYAEVIYMTVITVLGTIGNLIVIFSITLEKRVHAHGNVFIINLAVADFLVSALVNPTVIANIINGGNAVGEIFCDAIAYIVTSTCTVSLYNLMFIAINRYWAVVRSSTYHKNFRRKRIYYMMASTWIVSIIVVSPTVLGWGRLTFDAKILTCLWDDTADYGFTWFITTVAVIIPMGIIGFCYFTLFRTVRGSGRWVRSLSVASGVSQQSDQHRRSARKERSLLKTLITTVVLFLICWMPFALCVLINPGSTPAHLKKVAGWLALTNSCVNFIIYGAMNPVFRRGYHNLFVFLFRCKRASHVSSAMLHGSFSDSYRTRRQKGLQMGSGCGGNNVSEKETSRRDSAGYHLGASQVTQLTTMQNNSPNLARVFTSQQARNQPSPLTERFMPALSEDSRSAKVATLPTSASQKGIAHAFKRASTRRKAKRRASASSNDEEDRRRRAMRNSAMLLQIQAGSDASSDEDEFRQAHQSRYARRSQSEMSPIGRSNNDNRNNLNGSRELVLDVKDIAQLRRTWMPDRAVYTSKQNTPVNGTPDLTPRRHLDVATVSQSRPVQNDSELSPTKIPLIIVANGGEQREYEAVDREITDYDVTERDPHSDDDAERLTEGDPGYSYSDDSHCKER